MSKKAIGKEKNTPKHMHRSHLNCSLWFQCFRIPFLSPCRSKLFCPPTSKGMSWKVDFPWCWLNTSLNVSIHLSAGLESVQHKASLHEIEHNVHERISFSTVTINLIYQSFVNQEVFPGSIASSFSLSSSSLLQLHYAAPQDIEQRIL